MLTQCPSCHARATLVGDQDGVKVRCAECRRVYLARASRWRGARERRLLIAGVLFVLALLLLLFFIDSSACQGRHP
jgi:predicted Zn finger-like uncharacterized protein